MDTCKTYEYAAESCHVQCWVLILADGGVRVLGMQYGATRRNIDTDDMAGSNVVTV